MTDEEITFINDFNIEFVDVHMTQAFEQRLKKWILEKLKQARKEERASAVREYDKKIEGHWLCRMIDTVGDGYLQKRKQALLEAGVKED